MINFKFRPPFGEEKRLSEISHLRGEDDRNDKNLSILATRFFLRG